MDHQRFIENLPSLYLDWGRASVRPQSPIFTEAIEHLQDQTTANTMQLLNWAVECLEGEEIYCQVGVFGGANLIGALLDRSEKIAYAVDNFSSWDNLEELERLNQNLSDFNLEERVILCDQNWEEFFSDLKQLEPSPQIGIYFDAGNSDYRGQLLKLLLVKPFLSETALIVIGNSNYSAIQQANSDFLITDDRCQLLLDISTTEADDLRWGNGLQVFRWNANREPDAPEISSIEELQHQLFIESLANFQLDFEVNTKKKIIESLERQASTLESYYSFGEAEKKYREILQWDRNYAKAWYSLGNIYYKSQQYREAEGYLVKACQLDPDRYLYNYSLGLVLEKIGRITEAIEYYQQAIAIDPQQAESYNRLGNLLLAVGEPQLAKSQFQQALAIAPQDFVGYLNLGNLFEQQQQLETAIECHQKALKLAPQSPDVLRALGLAFALHGDEIQAALYQGHALYHQQNYTEAIAQYEKVLQAPTKDVNFYGYLGASYARIDRQEKAIEIYQAGIREYPQDAHLYFGLLFSLQYFGRVREAIAVAELGVKSIPDNFALKLQKATLLPIIYQNQDDIDFYRQRFSQELKALISGRSLTDPKLVDDAVVAIGFHTNFYLAYQGRNDLPLQILWGRFVHQLMLAKYPKYDRFLTMPPVNRGEKIRIGYVSAYLSSHSVGKLALGWLKNRDRQNFEIHCYYTSVREDSITQQFKLYSDVFHHIPESLESLCQQIITDKLHILVYLDLGMEPKTNQVAALRLAPVQCTAWGHPITSGLPTIDYFLSSDLMEPENGDEHYSEKLIRLANLGFSYGKPLLPEISKRRSEFQLEDEAIVYLSCQSLYKYLPQHDYIFAEIARRTPGAKFVFIASDISPAITNIFRQRLQRAFANLNLASEEYCSILPRLDSHYEYMNLLLVADIFLDTFAWSGGNTTLEALACNLPVVTCPGEFMRGRHSYGILQMMGMTETIARNEDEYIEIAVRLGLDTNWRNQIKEQIANNHHRLYDDKTCTIALEEFYRSVVYSGESAATTKLN